VIRIQIDKRALEDDAPETAGLAYAAGWRIEEDFWWVRPCPDPPPLMEPCFWEQRHVFAPDAASALAFDAWNKKITTK